MNQKIRFGTYIRETVLRQERVSYNDLVPGPETDSRGQEIPYRPHKVKLRGIDVYRLLAPYFNVRFLGQVKTVVPLAAYLILFQLLILRQNVADAGVVAVGLLAVIFGLMVFMEGLKQGLMPFGETIGHILPAKSPLPVVLFIVLLLGIGVTIC